MLNSLEKVVTLVSR